MKLTSLTLLALFLVALNPMMAVDPAMEKVRNKRSVRKRILSFHSCPQPASLRSSPYHSHSLIQLRGAGAMDNDAGALPTVSSVHRRLKGEPSKEGKPSKDDKSKDPSKDKSKDAPEGDSDD